MHIEQEQAEELLPPAEEIIADDPEVVTEQSNVSTLLMIKSPSFQKIEDANGKWRY